MLAFLLVSLTLASTADPEPCPTVAYPGFVLIEGKAWGRNPPETIQAARDDAYRQAEATYCAGRSAECCDALKRHIVPWGQGLFTPGGRKGSACAAVMVPASFLDATPAACDAFSGNLQDIMEKVRTRAGSLPISLEPTKWSTGCVAGLLGSAVAGQFKAALVGVQVLQPDQPVDGALRLFSEISPGTEGSVLLVVSVQAPDERAPTPVGSLSYFPARSSLTEDEVKQCRPNASLGLARDTREGDGGLTVDIHVATRDGTTCDGEVLEPSIYVSRPARVQVWNVDREGHGFLVWPPPTRNDRVEKLLPLGRFHVVRSDQGDERLVAVAIPEGARFGTSEGWTGYCRVDTFDGRFLPGGAAVGTATWTVLAPGVKGCSGNASVQATDAAYHAPTCGQR